MKYSTIFRFFEVFFFAVPPWAENEIFFLVFPSQGLDKAG